MTIPQQTRLDIYKDYRKNNTTYQELALKYNISFSSVGSIVNEYRRLEIWTKTPWSK